MEKSTPFPPSAPETHDIPPQYQNSDPHNQQPVQYNQQPVQYNQQPAQYNQQSAQYTHQPVQQPSQWDHIPALEGAPPANNYHGGVGSGPSSFGSGPSNAGAPAHSHAYTPTDPNVVPLTRLLREPQYIDCPGCNQRAETKVQGRSKGKMLFMNVFWWPLPNRRHWWEVTYWFCSNCDKKLAMQKDGKDLEILA